jgi:hypothetical protein
MLSDRFRAAVEGGDLNEAADLFSEDASFRSPVLFKPYEGRDQIAKVLQAAERVLGVGGQFRYVHQLEDPVDRVAILEFATVVDGKDVEGIDKLTFDDAGMITELKVMIRPASALQRVGAKMAEEFPKVGLRLPSRGTSTERREALVSCWPSARASATGALPTSADNRKDDQ